MEQEFGRSNHKENHTVKSETDYLSENFITDLNLENLDLNQFDHSLFELINGLNKFCLKNNLNISTMDTTQTLIGLCLVNEWLNLFGGQKNIDKPLEYTKLKSIVNRFKALVLTEKDTPQDDYKFYLNKALSDIVSKYTNTELSLLINNNLEKYFPYLMQLKSRLGLTVDSPNPFVIKILDISQKDLAEYEILPNQQLKAGGFADLAEDIVTIGVPFDSTNIMNIIEHEFRHAFSRYGLMHGKNSWLGWGINEAITEAGVTNPYGYEDARTVANSIFSEHKLADLAEKSYFNPKYIPALQISVFNKHGVKGIIYLNFMSPVHETCEYTKLYKSLLISPIEILNQLNELNTENSNLLQRNNGQANNEMFDKNQLELIELTSQAIHYILTLELSEIKNRNYTKFYNSTRATVKKILLNNISSYMTKVMLFLSDKKIKLSNILAADSVEEFVSFLKLLESIEITNTTAQIKSLEVGSYLWTNFINKQICFSRSNKNFNPIYSSADFQLTKLLHKYPDGYKS